MIRSMTGYGRGEVARDGYKATFEVTSVNSRHLEVSLRLPRGLLSYESPLRKLADSRLGRGKIFCQLTLERTDAQPEVGFNAALAGRYVAILRGFAAEQKIAAEISISDVARFPDVWTNEAPPSEDVLGGILNESLNAALDGLIKARETEGAVLAADLRKRLTLIDETLSYIKERAAEVPAHIRQKLTERIEDLFSGAQFDPQRLAQEVAFMADRADVTEECVRLDVHREHFAGALQAGDAVGRRLNFLVQEMNREANTIGSKSATPELSSRVVELKEELERIREQVQNVE